jgi:aspartate/methionine/tyrosine aminotransferase
VSPIRHSSISSRGALLAASPPMPGYMAEHFARIDEPWHAEDNPTGYTGMAIAENKLVADLVLDKLAGCRDVPAAALGYDTMTGSLTFRTALSGFLAKHVLGRGVAPDDIAVLGGAGSVLELLFYALADPGEAVLVPTPSYAGFWADLETRDAVTIVPVDTASSAGFELTIDQLDAAVAACARPVRALLFTSPNNPLGRVYTKDQISEVVDWADASGVHLVFDEIYALSVFGAEPFVGVGSLRPDLGENVHVVWAFSKDFGVSGLRCGTLITENRDVMEAVGALSYWAACSTDTQWVLGRMISDEAWVERFVVELQRRLGAAHREVTDALSAAGVPHLDADAGIFVVCDVRAFMGEQTWEAEHALWRRIVEQANVNLTPGAACHIAEPGFLRLCFAAAPTEAVVAGIERLAAALQS